MQELPGNYPETIHQRTEISNACHSLLSSMRAAFVIQVQGNGPPPREDAAICFHSGQLVMHGGRHDGVLLSDTWLGRISHQTIQWRRAASAHGFGLALAGHSLMTSSFGNILVTPAPRTIDNPSNEELVLWSIHFQDQGVAGEHLESRLAYEASCTMEPPRVPLGN